MAQISKDGEDSKSMSYFWKVWDLHVLATNLVNRLGSLPQVKQIKCQYGTQIKINWTHLDNQVEAHQLKAI